MCVWIAYNPAPRNDFWFFPVSLFLLRDFFLLVRKKSRFVYIFCCAKRNNPLVFWSYYMLHIFLGNSPAIFGNNIHKACQAFSDPRMAAVMQEQQPCGRCRYCLSLMCTWMNFECFTVKSFTLQAGIHISHLGKRKRHMLIPWRVMTLMSTIFLVSDLLFSCMFLSFFLVFSEFFLLAFWFGPVFSVVRRSSLNSLNLNATQNRTTLKTSFVNFHQLESH